MNQLTSKIEQWAVERGLHKGDSEMQIGKLYEEYGEMIAGHTKKNRDMIIDGIGDCYVVVVILCMQQKIDIMRLDWDSEVKGIDTMTFSDTLQMGERIYEMGLPDYQRHEITLFLNDLARVANRNDTTLKHCVEVAYNEISNRTGKMVDGVFIKSDDLKCDRCGSSNAECECKYELSEG